MFTQFILVHGRREQKVIIINNHNVQWLRMSGLLSADQRPGLTDFGTIVFPRKRVKLNMLCCCFLVAQSCPRLLGPHGLKPTRLLCPWDFSGKNTGVGSRSLLQGIFPTQGLNPCLLHWQADSLPLSHQGSLFYCLWHH